MLSHSTIDADTEFREFLNGPIYWSASTGAHPVVNSFLNRWGVHNYEAGWIGYPTSDEIVLPDGGRRQEFVGAAIYVAFQNAIGSAITNGPLRNRYNALGGLTPAGTLLGYPIQDQIPVPGGPGGQMIRFERGVIYWSAPTGAWDVRGSILDQWAAAGYEASGLGYPTAAQATLVGGAVGQQFQNGKLYSAGVGPKIGSTINSFSVGVPLVGQATAEQTPFGVAFHGNGYDIRFDTYTGTTFGVAVDLLGPQSPRTFKMMAAVPGGYSLRTSSSGRVELVAPGGQIAGVLGKPVGYDSANQGVPITFSVAGNEITMQLGSSPLLPIRTCLDSVTQNVDNYPTTGQDQILACGFNNYDCARAAQSKGMAELYSSSEFPGPDQADNRADALRHCLWQGYMTEMANADFALRMGNAHEDDAPGPPEANAMDAYNNVTGRAVGLRNEDDEPGIRADCTVYAYAARIVPNPVNEDNQDGNDLIALEP